MGWCGNGRAALEPDVRCCEDAAVHDQRVAGESGVAVQGSVHRGDVSLGQAGASGGVVAGQVSVEFVLRESLRGSADAGGRVGAEACLLQHDECEQADREYGEAKQRLEQGESGVAVVHWRLPFPLLLNVMVVLRRPELRVIRCCATGWPGPEQVRGRPLGCHSIPLNCRVSAVTLVRLAVLMGVPGVQRLLGLATLTCHAWAL